jgi:hypothetical protein
VVLSINVAVLLAVIIVVRLGRRTHARSRNDEKLTVVIVLVFGVLIAPTAFGQTILDVVGQLAQGGRHPVGQPLSAVPPRAAAVWHRPRTIKDGDTGCGGRTPTTTPDHAAAYPDHARSGSCRARASLPCLSKPSARDACTAAGSRAA